MSPQPVQPVTVTGFGTKAETVAKLSVYDSDPCPAEFCWVTPSSGKYVGLILVIFSSRLADHFNLEVYLGGDWVPLFDELDVAAGHPAVIPLYCYEPAMDVGDGTTSRVRLVGQGGANKSGFILYYEYE